MENSLSRRCPLCGSDPSLRIDKWGKESCAYIHCSCGLSIKPIISEYPLPKDIADGLWESWEKLVDTFPSIMRIREGDVILVEYDWTSHYFAKVVDVRIRQGGVEIFGCNIEKDGGCWEDVDESYEIEASNITLFPFELENVPDSFKRGWVDREYSKNRRWPWEKCEK